MSKLTCTDEMYKAFMASLGQLNFESEVVKDWIQNGVEAALAAMPVEVVGWQAMHEGELQFSRQKDFHGFPLESEPEPLFTHPDANTVNREVERQLRAFSHALKGLCKDFSDLQNRPYMGDVTSAVDGLLEQHVECLEIDEASRPSPIEPSTVAWIALGIPWRDTESQARQVAEAAAECINLMNGVGQPRPGQPLRYEARLRGRQAWESVSEAEARGYQQNLGLYEVRVINASADHTRMSPERYKQLSRGEDKLTVEERAAGWFFDDEYDGLLANRRWPGHEGF